MLRILSKNIIQKTFAAKAVSFRAMSVGVGISSDAEQQGGRRKFELDAIAAGGVGFNRDPIIPPNNAGTKENPILVLL